MKEKKFEEWQESVHSVLITNQTCPCATGDIEHCFLSLPNEAQVALLENDSILCFIKI